MLAQKIENQKGWMAALLTSEYFDAWELVTGNVVTYASFTIDGTYHEAFYAENAGVEAGDGAQNADAAAAGNTAEIPQSAEKVRYTPWKEVRPHFLALIRGKRLPLSFKFVLRLPDAPAGALWRESGCRIPFDDAFGLYLNLTYENGELILTTGSSYRTFTLDRSLDSAFDEYVRKNLVSTL